MLFGDQVVTEITAPNNVPFQPGFNIVGIGTEIPPELQSLGFNASIIFYTDDWDISAVTPRIKYYFIGITNSQLTVGYGYSNNPSTTPNATIILATQLGLSVGTITGLGLTDFVLRGASNGGMVYCRIDETSFPNSGALFILYDDNENPIFQIQPNNNTDSADVFLVANGSIVALWSSTQETFRFINSQNGYGVWVPCTYANGWGPSTPNFNRRAGVAVFRDTVGTVHMTGVAQGGTNTPGTYCVQLPSAAYRPAFGKAFLVHTQNAVNYATMIVDSGNGAISIVGAFATAGETNFECSWSVLV